MGVVIVELYLGNSGKMTQVERFSLALASAAAEEGDFLDQRQVIMTL